MRRILRGMGVAICLLAAPVSATTLTVTTELAIRTTDWTPFVIRDPDDPQNALIVGSQIFEQEMIFSGSSSPLSLPTLNTGTEPFDWIHLSHDLTMRVETRGGGISAGGFGLRLGQRGALFAFGNYGGRENNISTSGEVRSVGSVALDASDFALFAPGAPQSFFGISGGSENILDARVPFDDRRSLDFSILERSRHSGVLSGTITVTAGFAEQAEPALGASFITISAVPLPASGLLLGGAFVITAGWSRRKTRTLPQD